MKVYIGKPRDHWISPYTILDRVFFWTEWSKCSRWTTEQSLEDNRREKSQYVEHPEWVERWSDRLTPVSRVIQWVWDHVQPPINYVKIDYWDTWSMDHTLSPIILPMLKQLKEKKHGAPFVDDEDVPDELKSTAAPPKENEWDTDENHFARWEWIMEELIWTFTQLHPDSDWESQYHSGEIDIAWAKPDARGLTEMLKGPKDTHQFDVDGYQRHQARISNGLRLFGTYYRGLWD